MKKLPFLLIPIILLVGCTRGEFNFNSIEANSTIVLSTDLTNNITTFNEGISLFIFSENFEEDKEYLVSITSPSNDFNWEYTTKITLVASLKALVKTDLLYPPSLEAEEGSYSVELLLPDGRKLESSFNYTKANNYNNLILQLTKFEQEKEKWLIEEDQNSLIAKRVDQSSNTLMVIRTIFK
jgi:hypothetical protein